MILMMLVPALMAVYLRVNSRRRPATTNPPRSTQTAA